MSNPRTRAPVARIPRCVAASGLLLVLTASGVSAVTTDPLARADALWARRSEGQVDGRARAERAAAAVAAYQAALAAEPERLEAHWKLLRSLWFAAEFTSGDPDVRRRTHERALVASERAFAVLARRAGGADALAGARPEQLRELLPAADQRDAAELYFWHAVNLGAWSRLAGLLEAVRSGVANRLHEATLRSLALDASVEQGGALRLLSHLHAELPRVPLLSGWVDPARAVPLAERAASEHPQHPGNPYLLGLAILAQAPERRPEAFALIERAASLVPRDDHVVEDLAIQSDARRRLDDERWNGEEERA